MPPSDYHVVKHENGWAVERPRSRKPSHVRENNPAYLRSPVCGKVLHPRNLSGTDQKPRP